ncbi:hypothetical protein NDA14_003089 [Ustilago hordei]|uniref:Reverse transcriptase Ty1/copia-type domain-containing protein n=1 Tax=Ustilago hordei TaxID=120017 RepID=I2FPT8_USTHO|nr:hypothetical protein NDA10_001932 [Ustilago hordei]KAJ1597000.1 hypothetical protein NDA14_003089 [Ustilago hordei]CCF48931.1 uncharacterized protein UHOR_13469 [Ustilago hordei]
MPATEMINTLTLQEGDMASAEEICHYALLVGSLLWVAQGSRPNIAFAVGCCTQFVTNLSREHLAGAKQVLRYLKGTAGVSLTEVNLQPTVANSLVEAEYIALAAAARELLWTSMFLQELEQPVPRTAKIHCQDSYMFENCLA